MKSFATELRNFSYKRSPKTLFVLNFSGHFGAYTPALAVRSCSMNLCIALQRAKGVSSFGDFLHTAWPFSTYRHAKSPLILGTARNFAIFRLPLQHRLVKYKLHIWQHGRSNGGIAPTVTVDDLDLLL